MIQNEKGGPDSRLLFILKEEFFVLEKPGQVRGLHQCNINMLLYTNGSQ
jgi:hypothetical protein